MSGRMLMAVGGMVLAVSGGVTGSLWAGEQNPVVLVQIPYEAPPKQQDVPDVSVPPNTSPLTPEEMTRAEALLPLLEGKQEFWAMGEFVHLGEPSVPALIKGLAMPSPRIRYNTIETLSMMKGVSAVPALLVTAKNANEIPRVREHALRVAIRLDQTKTPEAIEVMGSKLASKALMAEAGVPNFEATTWFAVFATGGTPKPVIERLNVEAAKAVNDAAVKAKLQSLGGNPQPSTPGELAELIRQTTAKMRTVIQNAKIVVQ